MRRKPAAFAALLLIFLGFGLAACEDEKLIFPGTVPPTPTAVPTRTNTPDDEEDEED